MFNTRFGVVRLAFNLESQYIVILLLREVWTETTGVPAAIKGLVCFTDVSRMREVTGLESICNLSDGCSAFP